MKRMRNDYEDRGHGRFGGMQEYGMGMYGGYGGNAHDPYGALSPYGGGAPPREHAPPPVSDGLTQPAMMTLKQFLATQDDSISDEVAITRYNEYKLEFKRGQMNEFFVSHKDEEW
jgi:SERRATE/Ars2, N-terminal domain